MDEKIKRYLDKVVELLVNDTVIDHEQKLVIYPFIPNKTSQWGMVVPLTYVQYGSPLFHIYIIYCRDVYGLTYEESVYVWEEYKKLIGVKFR